MSHASPTPSLNTAAIFEPAAAVEQYLSRWIHQRTMPENLREAVEYALLAPGKRLRPILVLRSAEAVGGQAQAAMPAAAALEMIHNFSLVHDDLPAMDDDDLRRGRPTLHIHAGEAMGILGGDMLMGLAFELVATGLKPAQAGPICAELATATNDMIAGQVYDTLPDFGPGVDALTRLQTIHRHKTGALIRCACRMGALCAGAEGQALAALTGYGEAIGLMFQVVDDLLDVTQTAEQMGKRTGKDADAGKLTYPGVLGVDASRAEVRRLHDQAQQCLAELGPGAEPLRQLCAFMAVREK